MTNEHPMRTSGPWKLEDESRLSPDGSATIYYNLLGLNNEFIACLEMGEFRKDQRIAAQSAHLNARLLGAAADMIDALVAIESCLAPDENDYAAQKVRDAIHKAIGPRVAAAES